MAATTRRQRIDGANSASVRSAARLSAVQAVFQMDATSMPVERIVGEFVQHRLPEASGGGEADREFFSELVKGVANARADLDSMIESVLAEGWTIERMDRVLLSIIRCGACEIALRADIPPRVAISEYVDVARAFFDGNEPGFVNGVLDTLARSRRADEMEARPGDAPAETG